MPVYGSDTPIGAGMLWYTSTAPAGYLLCDGSAVSRTSFAGLFGILGTMYGTGNGSTTFNLPDLRQRFPVGKAASGTASTLAGTGGAIDHTHTVPAHHHAMGTGADLNITSSGAHSHGITDPTHTHAHNGTAAANFAGTGGLQGAQITTPMTITAAATGITVNSASHVHASASFAGKIGLVTGGVDGNAAMTSGTQNPPYLVINYIIKAA